MSVRRHLLSWLSALCVTACALPTQHEAESDDVVAATTVQALANACDDNVALGGDTSESDPGWGGGAQPWDLTDGVTAYSNWARGLAFTGGPKSWAGQSCGLRQATVAFPGGAKTVDHALVWHHGSTSDHIPRTYWLEYDAGGVWQQVPNESHSVRFDLDSAASGLYGATPSEHFFDAVTTTKLRIVIDNCDLPAGSDGHGWLYEFAVFGCDHAVSITQLSLQDIDATALTYLSSDMHDYFGGHTRVHGTFEVEGPPGEILEQITLSVSENGTEIASAELSASAGLQLPQAFPNNGIITVNTSRLLFELAATELTGVDQTRDGALTLSVVARLDSGEESEPYDVDGITKLVAFRPARRYGPPDRNVGGDVWLKPSARRAFERMAHAFPTIYWGDNANMNGGAFPPHTGGGHASGYAADAWQESYSILRHGGLSANLLPYTPPRLVQRWRQREENAASFLLQVLASDPAVAHIYVSPTPDHFFFWQAIAAANASGKITPYAGHETHFHIDLVQ